MSGSQLRHSGDDYAEALANLLPTGPAWPRDPDSDLMGLVDGLAQVFGDVDGRAGDLLETETDPRLTYEMLPDWESALGLPDPCVKQVQTVDARHGAVLNKITTEGGQSRVYFIGVAASLGYAITITEFSPFMVGIHRCGDTRPHTGTVDWFRVAVGHCGTRHLLNLPSNFAVTGDYPQRIGPPEDRFVWIVNVAGFRVSWFRCGVGQCGIDPLASINPATDWFRVGRGQCGIDPVLTINLAQDLECVLRRWKPAHTEIVFNYGQVLS